VSDHGRPQAWLVIWHSVCCLSLDEAKGDIMVIAGDILCGIDFSRSSESAARAAADLARITGAQVHLAHVVPLSMPALSVPEMGFAMASAVAPPNEQLTHDADAALARFALALGIPAARHVLIGAAAPELVRLAHELRAGVIVMGSHGKTALAHLVLGSTAERVIRHADVPVLVVPSPDRRH
jgi:universal stress protein A